MVVKFYGILAGGGGSINFLNKSKYLQDDFTFYVQSQKFSRNDFSFSLETLTVDIIWKFTLFFREIFVFSRANEMQSQKFSRNDFSFSL